MGNRDTTNSLERSSSTSMEKNVKVVLVGPAKCGKTALVHRFVNDIFHDTYVPTNFEKYSAKGFIDDYTIHYSIWDTSGNSAYDTVRPLAYQDANVFLLCFNIADPDTLDLAVNKWFSEIRSHCPTTPIVLCGCSSDSRNDIEVISHLSRSHKFPVTSDQALNACKIIGAVAYIETSSIYAGKAVYETFEIAAKSALGLTERNNNNNNSNYNKTNNTKKQQKKPAYNSPINKTNIKSELKARAKNCTIM